MDEIHAEHTVSVKLALYSSDAKKLLVMKYPDREGLYGLPGGHLEANELPDEALMREITEELGVSLASFKRADFFLRSGRCSSVILGYTSRATNNLQLDPPNPQKELGVWMTRRELEAVEEISSEYRRFALQNWPTK